MTQPFEPVPGRVSPRFSGIKTMLRLPENRDPSKVDAMILGIPFDGLSSFRPGSRFGPAGLREASSLARSVNGELNLSIFEKLRVSDGGDVFVNIFDPKETFASIENSLSQVFSKNCVPISVGGDHSITLPILRAAKAHFKKPISLFQVDAHADTYGPAWGVDVHHGTFVRHAMKEGLIDPNRSLQVGLRGPLAEMEDWEFGKRKKMGMVFARDIHLNPWAKTVKILDSFKKKAASNPVYVSFDIDGIDPAFAPGTGTPVPGGLTSWQGLELLRSLGGLNLIGADLVEISPHFDHAQVTQVLGVSVLLEFLSLLARRRTASK